MKDYIRCKTTGIRALSMFSLALTILLTFSLSAFGQEPYKIKKVVLDAGHGGKDPGCHGHNTKEKEIALSIALELGKRIKETHPDVDVIYTRDSDVFIPLNERAAIANRNKADLFISIHCNYIGVRNRATGSETYVLGLHRAEDNLDVAKRENASILLEEDYEKTYEGFDPYSPEGHIILSMFQNAHLEQSIMFATYVESTFKKLSKIPSRGVKQAGFLVLRETTMPSVLIETGFLSTDADENFLMKKENQQMMAGAILKAFTEYKKEVEDLPDSPVVAQAEEPKSKGSGPSVVQPKPAITSTDTIRTIYRIQIAASSKPNIDSRYAPLEDLEVIKENDLYKFLVGRFTTPEAAKPRLSALKANGFEGAFIVAYHDGKRVRA